MKGAPLVGKYRSALKCSIVTNVILLAIIAIPFLNGERPTEDPQPKQVYEDPTSLAQGVDESEGTLAVQKSMRSRASEWRDLIGMPRRMFFDATIHLPSRFAKALVSEDKVAAKFAVTEGANRIFIDDDLAKLLDLSSRTKSEIEARILEQVKSIKEIEKANAILVTTDDGDAFFRIADTSRSVSAVLDKFAIDLADLIHEDRVDVLMSALKANNRFEVFEGSREISVTGDGSPFDLEIMYYSRNGLLVKTDIARIADTGTINEWFGRYDQIVDIEAWKSYSQASTSPPPVENTVP